MLNGFIVIDIDHYECKLSYSMITSLRNFEIDANLWHAQLSHISQNQMERLTKQGLLSNYDKVDLFIFSITELVKVLENHLVKELEQTSFCNWSILMYVVQ